MVCTVRVGRGGARSRGKREGEGQANRIGEGWAAVCARYGGSWAKGR